MKQLIIMPPGAVSEEDKSAMREAGYLPVETDQPELVKLVMPGSLNATGDLVMMAALGALDSPTPLAVFARNIIQRMQEVEKQALKDDAES